MATTVTGVANPDEISEIKMRLDLLESRADAQDMLNTTTNTQLGGIRSKLDMHGSLLQALHLTQNEHTAKLDSLQTELTGFKDEMTEFKDEMTRFKDEVRGGFAKVLVGMEEIVRRLDDRDGVSDS